MYQYSAIIGLCSGVVISRPREKTNTRRDIISPKNSPAGIRKSAMKKKDIEK